MEWAWCGQRGSNRLPKRWKNNVSHGKCLADSSVTCQEKPEVSTPTSGACLVIKEQSWMLKFNCPPASQPWWRQNDGEPAREATIIQLIRGYRVSSCGARWLFYSGSSFKSSKTSNNIKTCWLLGVSYGQVLFYILLFHWDLCSDSSSHRNVSHHFKYREPVWMWGLPPSHRVH